MQWSAAIDRLASNLEVERGLSGNTVRAYRGDLAHLAAFASARGVVDVRDTDLDLLRDWLWTMMEGGASPAAPAPTAPVPAPK